MQTKAKAKAKENGKEKEKENIKSENGIAILATIIPNSPLHLQVAKLRPMQSLSLLKNSSSPQHRRASKIGAGMNMTIHGTGTLKNGRPMTRRLIGQMIIGMETNGLITPWMQQTMHTGQIGEATG